MGTKYSKAIAKLREKRDEILGQQTDKVVELIQTSNAEYDLQSALKFINNSKDLEHINEAIKLLSDHDEKSNYHEAILPSHRHPH